MLSGHLKTFLLGNQRSDVVCKWCGSQRTVRAGRCSSVVREAPIRHSNLWLKINKHRIYSKTASAVFLRLFQGYFHEEDRHNSLEELLLRPVVA